jgi:hypothetical protein
MKAAFEGTMPKSPALNAIPEGGAEIRQPPASGTMGNEIKLVSVMSMLNNEEVETRWGLHPRFRQDLTPDEMRELSRLMNRVTRIIGERYAAVAFSPNWAPWQQVGHA